jgi:hypothetical protein
VLRQPAFLHIGGNSSLRGTQEVIDAWRWKRNGNKIPSLLTIVSKAVKPDNLPDDVYWCEEVNETDLQWLQNSHQFHIYPSGTEGFGHAIHESLSVGATLLLTNAPPMNEIRNMLPICTSGRKSRYGMADVYEVSALEIHSCVTAALKLPPADRKLVREEFLEGNAAFAKAFAPHLEEVVPAAPPRVVVAKPKERQTVAFLGNFEASESTENMILWALTERLGMHVLPLQENKTTIHDLVACTEWEADYFLWVRTPGWLKVPDHDMFRTLMEMPCPSISLHLDKFWGIAAREELIGKIPFWQTDYVFTADGSRQKDFGERGVNHIYMEPAASEVYAHPGTPRDHYRCDVAFVGARTYHSEHPFRGQMITFLEVTYGERFKLVEGGLRGHDLNDFYASARVVVGDCFGSGKISFYWSDRMVETPMRYGFLLSPDIDGLSIPLARFEPENLADLRQQIEYWLGHEKERCAKIVECAKHVRTFDTWTERLLWILGKVDGERKKPGRDRSKPALHP